MVRLVMRCGGSASMAIGSESCRPTAAGRQRDRLARRRRARDSLQGECPVAARQLLDEADELRGRNCGQERRRHVLGNIGFGERRAAIVDGAQKGALLADGRLRERIQRRRHGIRRRWGRSCPLRSGVSRCWVRVAASEAEPTSKVRRSSECEGRSVIGHMAILRAIRSRRPNRDVRSSGGAREWRVPTLYAGRSPCQWDISRAIGEYAGYPHHPESSNQTYAGTGTAGSPTRPHGYLSRPVTSQGTISEEWVSYRPGKVEEGASQSGDCSSKLSSVCWSG